MKWVLVVFGLAIFVSGCEYLTGGKDNSEPPHALVPLDAGAQTVQWSTVWRHSIGHGEPESDLRLKPLVLSDRIVTVDHAGLVQAYDLKKGKRLWERLLSSPVSGGVGGDEHTLVLACADGYLVALDPQTGQERWVQEMGRYVVHVPALAEDQIFVQSTDGAVFAFSESNGKLNWEYQSIIPNLTLFGTGAPIVSQDKVFVGLSSGRLLGLSRKTGALEWEYTVAEPEAQSSVGRLVDVVGRLIVEGNRLYAVSFQGQVVAVDLQTGRSVWQRQMSSDLDMAIGQHLYISDSEGTVWALDLETGQVAWEQRQLHARDLSGVALFQGYVVVGDYQGYLHALSTRDGHFVARTRAAYSGIRVTPEVFADQLYCLSRSAVLGVYELRSATSS
jgi:outer membrane protein assembly factor BamB